MSIYLLVPAFTSQLPERASYFDQKNKQKKKKKKKKKQVCNGINQAARL